MEYRPKFPPRIWTWCISYEEWKKTYKPKEENLPFVPKDVDPSYVWSECWCDGVETIVPSIHFINITGYAITEVPHDENSIDVFVGFANEDVEEEAIYQEEEHFYWQLAVQSEEEDVRIEHGYGTGSENDEYWEYAKRVGYWGYFDEDFPMEEFLKYKETGKLEYSEGWLSNHPEDKNKNVV